MTKVYMDVDPDTMFEAAHLRDMNWNGWAIPYFSKEEGLKIADWSLNMVRKDGLESGDLVIYSSQDDLFYLAREGSTEPLPVNDDYTGRHHQIAPGWTWAVATSYQLELNRRTLVLAVNLYHISYPSNIWAQADSELRTNYILDAQGIMASHPHLMRPEETF